MEGGVGHLLFAGPVLAVRLSSSVFSPALCRTILESTSQKSTRPECPMIAKYWFFKVLMLIHRGFTYTDVSKLGWNEVIMMLLKCMTDRLSDSLTELGLLVLELLSQVKRYISAAKLWKSHTTDLFLFRYGVYVPRFIRNLRWIYTTKSVIEASSFQTPT